MSLRQERLGGVSDTEAIANNPIDQIFGYKGTDVIAFGEFIFNTEGNNPQVTFILIDEFGEILEEHILSYDQLISIKH